MEASEDQSHVFYISFCVIISKQRCHRIHDECVVSLPITGLIIRAIALK